MSTDRELLELAAKAAGLHVYAIHETSDGTPEAYLHVTMGSGRNIFSPFRYNYDAFWLAVKTRVWIVHAKNYVAASISQEGDACHEDGTSEAATRRAIVRAAAAIGGDSNG